MPKTSRKDGILVLKTDKPYKMAINGKLEQRNIILCFDINNQAESAAFDLEQYFDVAIFDMAEKQINKSTPARDDDKKEDDFFKKDSPSNKEIEEKALGIEMLLRSNKAILISKILETFNEIIQAGLIKADGGITMTSPIWQTIHRDDKLKIVFWYAAFFVNPLQRLSAINASLGIKSEQGEIKNKEMQSELPISPAEE
jgi:hypothetical protein